MIKFEDGEILQYLPECVRKDTETICISYAAKKGMQKLIMYSKRMGIYSAIDELPEKILDLLAVELRSQYYDENIDIQMKREILKKTLMWYRHAGTPSAVQELVETVFGEGEVQEWFEYDGKPYRFKIVTNAELKPDTSTFLNMMIKKVKNTRSRLDSIDITRKSMSELFVGGDFANVNRNVITDSLTPNTKIKNTLELFAASDFVNINRVVIM